MGSRLLADRLSHPSQQLHRIQEYHDAIAYRYERPQDASQLAGVLMHCGDFPRMYQKIRNKKDRILTLASFVSQTMRLLDDELFVSFLKHHDTVLFSGLEVCIAYFNDAMADTIISSNDRVRP